MGTLQTLTGKNYLSYSAMNSWQECGERFRLERILNAPQAPAWWFFIGDVIHKATEDCDLDNITDQREAMDYFWSIWEREYPKIENLKAMRVGGKATKEWPKKENEDYWRANGPLHVAAWVAWRTAALDSGWNWYTLPNGEPAIEVALEVDLGDVLVKGYADRIMVNPDAELCVIDLKSGSKVPDSPLQLATYAVGVKRKFGVKPSIGHYFMTRKGELTEGKSLLHYTDDMLSNWYTSAKRGIESEIFIPHVTHFCNTCAVAPYCAAIGGSESALRLDVTQN